MFDENLTKKPDMNFFSLKGLLVKMVILLKNFKLYMGVSSLMIAVYED